MEFFTIYLANEEIMTFLVKYHYKELLSQKEYKTLDARKIYKQIKKRLIQLDNILLGKSFEQDQEAQLNRVK